ncbi:MAG: adenylyl cyclase [Acidobacteria bacterium]|nr:MAG: adenylyl cyclase [Acidobacteriota bacterium]
MEVRKKSWLQLVAALVSALVLAGAGLAQEITGDIRGLVRDPSGAVVSGATVQIINTERGRTERTITTGPDGSYVASTLPVGRYQVVVTTPGFQKHVANNIVLNINDRRVVDAKLQVGTTNQTVDVQEAQTQVDLDTPTAAGLITGTQIRELALNTRNFAQLVALSPGVSTNLASDQLYVGATSPTGLSNQMNFSVNGNRPTQNNWTIDGADNFDRGANLTLLNYPSIDALAEFKILRSNYLPEQGRSSGGEINLVTRSGTNNFHGSAYEYFRNDVLNANNFFNNRSQIKRPPLRWNDFGFTVGGPIVKNKTFFFYSQEWRKIGTFTTFNSDVLPTTAELQGRFPTAVCVAFAANGTCTSQSTQVNNVNPVAAAYVKDVFSKIQAPNNSDGTLTSVGKNVFNYREELVRLDHSFGSRFNIFGRYLDDSIPTQEPGGIFTGNPVPGVANTTSNAPGRGFVGHATFTITPTLLNDAGYAYSYGAVTSDPTGLLAKKVSPDVTPTLPFASTVARIPNIDFNTFANNSTGQGLFGFGAYRDFNTNHNIFDNLTWVHGNHAFKFGASYNYYIKDENVNGGGGNDATFFFSDAGGGAPADGTFAQTFANFLTGNVASFSQTNIDFRALVHQQQIEFYGQDEWRLRPNFTFDYGVRYSLFFAPTYGNGLLSTFDPQGYNPANAPAIDNNGLLVPGTPTPITNGMIIGGKNSPFGDAVQKTNNANIAPRIGFAWDPYGRGTTSIRAGYGIFYDSPAVNSVENFIPGNPPLVRSTSISNTNFSNPGAVAADIDLAPPTVGGPSPHNYSQPYSQMFNLDVQHQFTHSTTFDVGYYGSLGRHLPGVIDVNMPHIGDFLSAGIPAPFSNGNVQKLNQVRPFKGYDAINLFMPVFTSNYNGLQTQLQQQLGSSSLVVLNYTWSKNLTTASNDFRSPQYVYNILADYGPSDLDRRHIFTGSYVYTLPFFRQQDGVVGHVLGGWELSGIVYLNSGHAFTASSGVDRGGLGLAGNTFSGGRPDMNGSPNVNAPHTATKWFDTSVFSQVPTTQIRPGNEKRGTIVGPDTKRWDANLFKNTKISERFTVQFRAEAFNVLNHTNFDTLRTSSTSSTFGKVLTARDPRQLQLALKLLF